jgi:hypothetical protein
MRKLRDIVEEVMLSHGMPTVGADFMRLYQLGIDGLREVSQQTANPNWAKKMVSIELNEAGVAPLPADFVDYYYVGICVGGFVRFLIHSPNMCPPMTDNCGDMIPVDRVSTWLGVGGFDVYNKPVEYQIVERGHFSINWEGRYIVVEKDGLAIDSIKLVYKSSIEQVNGDYMVYEHDEWPVKAAIEYGLVRTDVRLPLNHKAFFRQEYINKKRIARKANNSIKINEVLDALRR